MSALGAILLQLIPLIPSAIPAFVGFYNQIKGLLTPSDQTAIDQALAAAQSSDAAATAQADTDLAAAAKK
jgi:hypothetical protein